MTTGICNSVSGDGEATATQLVDIRDNKLYWVAKLKDGHCWMTQNLDFDINTNAALNSNTTDLNAIYDSSTGQYTEYNNNYTINNGIIYWAPASTATTIGFQSNGPVSGWQNSYTAPYSANKTDSTETGHTSLGNYYNWTAAIASNDSSTLTQDTLNNISNNPKNSICPKGWRLPTISSESEMATGSTNEFARLNYLYNNGQSDTGIGLLSSPIYLAKSGYVRSNLVEKGVFGGYLYSTFKNINDIYTMAIRNTISVPGDIGYNVRDIGWSVRCVAH
jgi:uncharacterized protein (TIGR02145 family)